MRNRVIGTPQVARTNGGAIGARRVRWFQPRWRTVLPAKPGNALCYAARGNDILTVFGNRFGRPSERR